MNTTLLIYFETIDNAWYILFFLSFQIKANG